MTAEGQRVILDARMIGHSGIGTYIRGLLDGWLEIAPDFRPTLLGDPDILNARLANARHYSVVDFRAPVYGLREQLWFPAGSTRGALLHCPHYNIALRHRGPLIVTIHDLVHLDERCGLRSWVRRFYARLMLQVATRRPWRILADSQTAADDLVARLNVGREKITVVHAAPSGVFLTGQPDSGAIEQLRREANLPADYLLTVGLYKPHKNLDLLFEAFRSLRRSGKSRFVLAVAGTQPKERAALRDRLAQLGISDEVRVLDWLPSERFALLYRGTKALVHTALLEGFGLPIVEAQAAGTPVVASRIPVLREVAGDGAQFFDPHDADDLARQIVAVIENKELRERLVATGRENVKRFSWQESARKVLTVYDQVWKLYHR